MRHAADSSTHEARSIVLLHLYGKDCSRSCSPSGSRGRAVQGLISSERLGRNGPACERSLTHLTLGPTLLVHRWYDVVGTSHAKTARKLCSLWCKEGCALLAQTFAQLHHEACATCALCKAIAERSAAYDSGPCT